MYWLEVSVRTDGEAAEAVAELLRPFAYDEGVVLEQLGDADNPDHDALELAVTVKIYIPEDNDSPALRRRFEEMLYHLGRLYPIPAPQFRELKDEDWANAWKAHYHPFRVGRLLWIQPSWEAPSHAAGEIVITLDPGMAFGTGLHPTTQMCLQALESCVQSGMRVLDVGTGSGILAIAALRLGAAEVLAIDSDRVAVRAASENAAHNLVADRIEIRPGTLADVRDHNWDVLVVNILAQVIIELLSEAALMTYLKHDGRLILSGIIDQQAAAVEAAVTSAGGFVEQRLKVRDWVALLVRPA